VRAGYGTIEYGIAPYATVWRTEMGGHVCTAARAGDLISKSALLESISTLAPACFL
jgi:hypothetical protein